MEFINTNLEELFEYIKNFNIWEFRIVKLEKMKMILIGCYDLSYLHDLEICFEVVNYLSCPTIFKADRVRLANEEEKAMIGKNFINVINTIVLCFEKFDAKYFIVADSLKYKKESVDHFKIENGEYTDWIQEWKVYDEDIE